MSMLPDWIIPITTGSDGRVLDFVGTTGLSLITDYTRLDQRILAENSVDMKVDGEQQRVELSSIKMLTQALEKYVSEAMNILQQHTPYDPMNSYTYPDFSDLKKDLLIQQLIFDVLFDKYIHESELMTRNGYSSYMAEKLYPDDTGSNCHAINEKLTRGMRTHHDRMAYSKLSEQVELLGVDPERYAQYYIPHMNENPAKKKPKFIWDLLYYNFVLDLTSRQYRRQLTRESRNYPYDAIFTDCTSYYGFVAKLLPAESESYEKYFRMSMDYYTLESYKRVDFIFKLIDALDSDEIDTINKHHFLVNRFVPYVLVPFMQDGELHFTRKYNYYRPLFIIEDMLLKELPIKKTQLKKDFPQEAQAFSNACERYFESQLKKYQYVRAKAYELFKYHCVFHSDNYTEIKAFLRECYDMRAYHQSVSFWRLIQDTTWKEMDGETKRQVKDRMRHLLTISDSFFWKSPNRDYTIPSTSE